MRQELRRRTEREVVRTAPLLTQDGEGLIWPHTVNLLQGQTGAHKSRLAELITSVLIAETPVQGDALGLAVNPARQQPYAVCYVDTERNQQEQFIQSIQQMKARAGYDIATHPDHFDYISLLTIPRADRLVALKEYLQEVRAQLQGHLLIVLDQLADCVADFNDQKECLLLADLLNVMVNQQDVTFFCIIHENPGGSKARGHLGTELANKASTVMQIGFVKAAGSLTGEVVQVNCLKRRSGAPGHKFFARYDPAQGGLVRAGKGVVKAAIDSRKQTALPTDLVAVLGALLTERTTITKLKKQLARQVTGCGKTIGARLVELAEQKISIPNADGEACILCTERKGKNVWYWLEPVSGLTDDTGNRKQV